ncbi:peroxide stress protein YaaA [Moraxella bovis]|uniref:peroxide stress protein YaaA n=1 Tax=Moraxella bovis TaxID=476 RepID=UPI002226ED24|nr:peroxide stress protein YaaA [Moraxella bovis]UYZ71191.1 peroxide stress protein YaaA [Moraxella bovis]UZA14486.1 peroxide stress protein YaaA [Moraxella bovis]UZA38313.1 peroxide stress protein YaaA [Moraxella bovis]UZA42776.1 peroxide stress protein YaaA [Moraxella bovis]
MYCLISPAKNLDEKTAIPFNLDNHLSKPILINHAIELMKTLKNKDVIDLQELMGVSAKIAELNVVRNQNWTYPFDDNKKPAIYLFDGDVYTGLDAYSLNTDEILYLNQHLGILSGLYGILKPLDNMLPYRLEMGTKLKTPHADDLYGYWSDEITDVINDNIKNSGSDVLINLASNEYFKVINTAKIKAEIITPKFLDQKNGQYKIVSFYAKKARGMMMNFCAKNQITNPDKLKNFDMDGYYFDEKASSDDEWMFKRDEQI